jgi:hypothetical protein
MRFWANLVGYQLVWFAIVSSAGAGRAWLGICAVTLFVGAQLVASHERRADLGLAATAIACGLMLDGTLARSGVVQYAGNSGVLPAPIWILALWAAFAMTLNHSLAWLRGRAVAAALLGGIGGPLDYLAAERASGAVAIPQPQTALVALALGWSIALAVLSTLASKWRLLRASEAGA